MAAQKKYPDELRERAVKIVLEIREREGKGHGEISRVARQLDVHPEALRSWLQQAEIDEGKRPGTTTDDKQRIAELEREVRELRRDGLGGAGPGRRVPSPAAAYSSAVSRSIARRMSAALGRASSLVVSSEA